MEHATPRELFEKSLDRCLQSNSFIPTFYDKFLDSSVEVRKKFVQTDFRQQNRMLAMSLKLTAAATAGVPAGLAEIKMRCESHDRHHLDIKPHLYDLWLSSVIASARLHDKSWDARTEDAWKTILGHVINRMKKAY